MSKLNFLVYLNTYSDARSSNAPSMSNFKWTREIEGIPAGNPLSEGFSLAPGETKTLFDGTRTLASNSSTAWDLTLKPLSTNTYVLKAAGAPLPNFRTPRAIGSDATTAVSVTVNGPLATFASSAGTPFDFSTTVVGDYIRVGNLFSQSNQGEHKVLAKTATSVTVELYGASVESGIVLGAGFADQFQVYSAAGVQKGDTLVISGGFSIVSQRSYKITDVAANYIEFYLTDVLPQESGVTNAAIAVYSAAKQLIYLETDQKILASVNGAQNVNVEPFIINDSKQPGVFMLKATAFSLAITNQSTDTATLYLASVE